MWLLPALVFPRITSDCFVYKSVVKLTSFKSFMLGLSVSDSHSVTSACRETAAESKQVLSAHSC